MELYPSALADRIHDEKRYSYFFTVLCRLSAFVPYKLHTFYRWYSSSYLCYNLSSSFSAFLFPPVSLPLSLPLSSCRHSINQVIESIMRRWAGPRAPRLGSVGSGSHSWGSGLFFIQSQSTVGAADSPFYSHNPQSGHQTILFTTYNFFFSIYVAHLLIFVKCLISNPVIAIQAGHTTLPT
jgi:hypothetical protein